ncbi:GerMN domain-containing protein [Microbacterium kyungheense]|uniref:Lipoprotein LpqB-like beta-propeller protein n=1 Tax=Microbacterium kyungheense TaxID=1263636 RepID=A0A543FLK8_9MICO|nr:LpqB family beta-propeller domain-containing protein [Microbacterium kyungheense]TQM34544.1 lipoprotein LpqB-like beta-propeller protein [Microbacterium kyungheense]
MTRARGILALIVALCAVLVTGCAGFPESGSIQYGLETGADTGGSQNVTFIPNRPQPGATPQQIVEGFIDAGSGPGVRGTWDVAKEFLAPDLKEAWDPLATVRIDERAERDYAESATGEGSVTFSYEAVADLDDIGSYKRAELAANSQEFRLAKQSDGEWRITEAPDGIWLDEGQFPQVFRRYSLMYFDPTWQYLVPDVRWFPSVNAASTIAVNLVNKPRSEWLAESVKTAFPDGAVVVPSVQVDEQDVAIVDFEDTSLLSANPTALDRMVTQLRESLHAAGVADVVMRVDSTPVEASPVAVRSTRVPAAPLVLTADGFGFLAGDEIDQIPGLSPAVVAAAPTAVQVGPEHDVAAVKLPGGEVARLTSTSTAPEVLDTRAGLADPVVDGFGYVWSVPKDQPTALQAYAPQSIDPIALADAWPDATAVSAMALSRDGTRMAATVTSGGRTVLWVAGVLRDGDNVPVALGPTVPLAIVGGPADGVTWVDDVTVGVLARGDDASIVVEQPVGGPTATSSGTSGMASIAGGNGTSSLRLRAEDGTLFVKRGTAWQPTATGVLLLATQQGSPQ